MAKIAKVADVYWQPYCWQFHTGPCKFLQNVSTARYLKIEKTNRPKTGRSDLTIYLLWHYNSLSLFTEWFSNYFFSCMMVCDMHSNDVLPSICYIFTVTKCEITRKRQSGRSWIISFQRLLHTLHLNLLKSLKKLCLRKSVCLNRHYLTSFISCSLELATAGKCYQVVFISLKSQMQYSEKKIYTLWKRLWQLNLFRTKSKFRLNMFQRHINRI